MTAKKKFGREYTLKIQATTGPDIVVELPLTVEVSIHRKILSSVNNASIRIYNLGPEKREQIRKDSNEYFLSKRVELYAGYGNDRDIIFTGNILSAFSVREGTNFITTIEAFDGGFAINNTSIEKSYGRGTKYSTISADIMTAFGKKGIGKGVVGEIEGKSSRGNALTGNAFETLNTISNGGAFIDNEKINVLGDDEYISGSTPVIESDTGLLGTPKIEGARLSFSMIFEPKMKIGQRIKLNSITNGKLVNSKFYKVLAIKHNGVFSSATSGTMTTEIEVIFGIRGLREVK